MRERNAALHRRILELSGHRVASDVCARLHSQVVRFQFRAIVSAIAGGDGEGAERAMRQHLTNVAETLARR